MRYNTRMNEVKLQWSNLFYDGIVVLYGSFGSSGAFKNELELNCLSIICWVIADKFEMNEAHINNVFSFIDLFYLISIFYELLILSCWCTYCSPLMWFATSCFWCVKLKSLITMKFPLFWMMWNWLILT